MTADKYEFLNSVAIMGDAYDRYEDDEQPKWHNVQKAITKGFGRIVHYQALAYNEDDGLFEPDPTKKE